MTVVLTDCVTVMLPPIPEIGIAVPSGNAPNTLLKGSTIVPLAVAETVPETVAATPLLIALLFKPLATHVIAPVPLLQFRVFPAAVMTGPAVTVGAVIAPVG